jgi:hypothetical protein
VPFAVKHDDGTKTARRDTLADALELHGAAAGWLRFRDRRSGLESLRSVGEIRDRGLHVELGAYECLVLDELREVVSTAETPWAGLAGELRGRGVVSLDEALADHRLRPVHEAIGRLLVARTDDDIATRRAELAAVAGIPLRSARPAAATGTVRARAARARAVRVDAPAGTLAEVPAAGSRAGDVDPAARAAIRLRPLDRATFDSNRIATALRVAGFDAGAIERTRVALELAHPRTTPDAAALAASWLADPAVRDFLQVHEWEGVEWLVRERWVALVRLADALDRASGAQRSSPAIAGLLPAAEAAGDRVDRIVPAARSASKRPAQPRRPRSGGLADRPGRPSEGPDPPDG